MTRLSELREAVRGVVVSCVTVRANRLPDGRYAVVGQPQDWVVTGITKTSVILAPVNIHDEAMFDKRKSFKLPSGEHVNKSAPSSELIHPDQTERFNRMVSAC